jgi:hypothetical protein
MKRPVRQWTPSDSSSLCLSVSVHFVCCDIVKRLNDVDCLRSCWRKIPLPILLERPIRLPRIQNTERRQMENFRAIRHTPCFCLLCCYRLNSCSSFQCRYMLSRGDKPIPLAQKTTGWVCRWVVSITDFPPTCTRTARPISLLSSECTHVAGA